MFYTRYSHTICEHGVPVFPCDIVTKATFKKLGQTLSGSIVVNLLTNFKDDSGMTLEHQVGNESQVRPIYPKTQFHSSVPCDQPIFLFAAPSSTGLIYHSKVNGHFWLSSSSPSDTNFCSMIYWEFGNRWMSCATAIIYFWILASLENWSTSTTTLPQTWTYNVYKY